MKRPIWLLVFIFIGSKAFGDAEPFHVLLQSYRDGSFRFYVSQFLKQGCIRVVFSKEKHAPEVKNTFSGTVQPLVIGDDVVFFGIGKCFFKFERDRSVLLWGGEEDDRFYIHLQSQSRETPFHIDCKCLNGGVWLDTVGACGETDYVPPQFSP